MSTKIAVHQFDPQIYPRLLWVAITTESKIDGFDELSKMDDSCIAVTEHTRNNKIDRGGVMVRFSSSKASISTVAHEAAHAAMMIIDYIGGRIDLNNQEYFCYLCGWIAKCCNEVLEEIK